MINYNKQNDHPGLCGQRNAILWTFDIGDIVTLRDHSHSFIVSSIIDANQDGVTQFEEIYVCAHTKNRLDYQLALINSNPSFFYFYYNMGFKNPAVPPGADEDGDGVWTKYENPDPNGDGDYSDAQDTDSDGTPDYLDDDDDGDGILTKYEHPDPNGDGNPSDAQDTDEDGIPDYLDNDISFPYYTAPSSLKILPEVIWAKASGGGKWITEIQITDLTGGSEVLVTFYYGEGNSRGPFLLWTSPGVNHSVKYKNLLKTIDGLDMGNDDYYGKAGAVMFRTQDSDYRIHVSARIKKGKYSKIIQGLNLATENSVSYSFHGMIQNLTNNATYRTTIGCFEFQGIDATIEFKLINGDGHQVGNSFIRNFIGYDFQSFNPFDEAGVPYPEDSYDNICLLIKPSYGSCIVWGATTNNITSDPALHRLVFSRQGWENYNSPTDHQVLPEVRWAPDEISGTWITETQITDMTETGGSEVYVTFYYGGGNRRGPFLLWTAPLRYGEPRSIKFTNLMEFIDGLDTENNDYYGKIGAVEFKTQDDFHKIYVAGRISNGNISKTFQALNLSAANTASISRQMMIQNLTSNDTYKTSISCFNPYSANMRVKFKLINKNGGRIGSSFKKKLVGYDFQTFDPFAEAGVPYPEKKKNNVWLLIKPIAGPGVVMCWGTTTNNLTNDPAAHRAVQKEWGDW